MQNKSASSVNPERIQQDASSKDDPRTSYCEQCKANVPGTIKYHKRIVHRTHTSAFRNGTEVSVSRKPDGLFHCELCGKTTNDPDKMKVGRLFLQEIFCLRYDFRNIYPAALVLLLSSPIYLQKITTSSLMKKR